MDSNDTEARSSTAPPLRAGVVGIGQVGRGVALCLDRVGALAGIYDIRSDLGDDLPPIEPTALALAKKCDVVLIAVVTADQAIDVLSGEDGILAAGNPNQIIVLLATVSLPDLERVRSVTDAAGVVLIDCGVMGAARSAENGMVCLVGAEPEALERVRPVLDGFARYIAHMGGPGAGMTAKIVRNVAAVGSLRVGYEMASLAKAAGVDLKKVMKAIDDTADANVGPMIFWSRERDPAVDPAEYALRESLWNMIIKDAQAALDLGGSTGVDLSVLNLVCGTGHELVGLEPSISTDT